MKEFKMYALLGAAALLGVAGLSSCSSSDDEGVVAPGGNGAEVKAQFAISIPAAQKSGRMSETNTQSSGNNFLGMSKIYLLPIETDTDVDAATTYRKTVKLSDIETTEISGTQSAKIYKDISIAVGTNKFLFYAQAPGTDKIQNGALTSTLGGTTLSTADIKFNLNKIITDGTFSTELSAAAQILTDVANVAGWSTTVENALIDLRTAFLKTQAASAQAIKDNLRHLYNAMNGLYTTDATKFAVANEVMTKIGEFITVSADGESVSAWKATAVATDFPENHKLPQGSAAVVWDTNKFVNAVLASVMGNNSINPTSICYPSSINYFVNTALYANNSLIDASAWPKTTTEWSTDANWSGWGNKVLATTQSIALKDNIQYGVALLKSTVKAAASSLYDSGESPVSDDDVLIPVGSGFTVNGILVGGQPSQAGWNFQPTNDATFDLTVYDQDIPSNMVASPSTSVINYTLLLDNYKADAVEKVKVALELVNTSDHDFYGHANQLVAKGAKFYLVAELDFSNTNNTNKDGATHVFEQDFTTTANFVINELRNAYVTIPDLRATNLQLGLSVDLSWKEGVVFNDVVLGGN